MAAIFPPLTTLSIMALAVTVMLQGAVLVATIYFGETYFFESFHPVLVIGIGIGAVAGALALIGAAFRMTRRASMTVVGKPVTRQDNPQLFKFVGDLARRLNAKAPGTIVLGLEPNFYVTSADIAVVGEERRRIRGETLFMSLPLARVFTQDELAAVIGHELGHFRGRDTAYSLRFAPVYQGLRHALTSISGDGQGGTGLASLPALAVLGLLHDVFSRSEAEVSRIREFEADKAGVEAASAEALALALLKVSLYAEQWRHALDQNAVNLSRGYISRNMSRLFADRIRYDIDPTKLPEAISHLLEERIPHPIDTHPPIGARLEALGLSPTSIDPQKLMPPGETCGADLVDGLPTCEEELTTLEHRIAVTVGAASVPENRERTNKEIVLRAVYLLAAQILLADGKIDLNEVLQAEERGRGLFEEFDSAEFREILHHPQDIPEFDKLLELLRQLLTDEGCTMVRDYVLALVAADGRESPEERAKLDAIEDAWFGRRRR
jgi:Zn-dependent protease with chaperone function